MIGNCFLAQPSHNVSSFSLYYFVKNTLLGMLQRGEVDIAGSDFTITSIRDEVVDFLEPLVKIHLRLFIINPAGGNNWGAFVRPMKNEAS